MSWLERGGEDRALWLINEQLGRDRNDPTANKLRAMIHGAHDQYDNAAACLRRCVGADPTDMEAQLMLGNVLLTLRSYEEAAAAYHIYVKSAPTDPGAVMGLAQCLVSLGRLEDGVRAMEDGNAASPDDANMYGCLASILVAIGHISRAMELVKRGYARLPQAKGLLAFLVQNSNFIEGVDPVEHRQWHEELCAGWVGLSQRPTPAFTNSKEPGRMLRVGFMSGDFRHHACAYFLRGLLFNFDRTRIQPVCYMTNNIMDSLTTMFMNAFEMRQFAETDDDTLAATIVADRIDILIDCAGQFEGNRLPSLIPRVAPIQCTFLGYPNTTGMPTMDYRIVDAITDPPENDSHLSEKAARLPGCFLCFTPSRDSPEVGVRDMNAPISFGSFNRLDKVTDGTLDVWCRVLAANPTSTMTIKSRMMTRELMDAAIQRFTSRGIEASRIIASDYVPDTRSHLSMYRNIDIALDAFPYNGTTTTCESIWMGVPVVTLRGNTHRARVGTSLLTALGLEQLIASDADQYVQIASQLAADRTALAAMRTGLRPRMAASPLCDDVGYSRKFEALLREMWARWCETPAGSPGKS
jgi:predicted O-linked N-acetylglucosamine transferase (SPINDLY family)